jgi:hypothetical protein
MMFICMYIITTILLVGGLFMLSLPDVYTVGAIILFILLSFTFAFRNKTDSEDAYLFVAVHPTRVVPAMIKESNRTRRY